MTTRLQRWLERLGLPRPPPPDLAGLTALHQAHLGRVPFENLDVQLGRKVGVDPEAAFEKVVERRRGGWCYELNGLFAWGLAELGFDVARLSAGVMRETSGDAALGNHLCLAVRLPEGPHLCDVGFGGSLSSPLKLEPTERHDPPYHVSLEPGPGGFWRYLERGEGEAFSFDFSLAPPDEALLSRQCAALQTDPGSTFVQNLVVQRRDGVRHLALRGRVLTTFSAIATTKRVLSSADELCATLRETFGLDVPEAAALWPRVCARHEVVFPK